MRNVLLVTMLAACVAILAGGCAWIWGRLRGRAGLRLWGGRLAFGGVCLDAALLLSNAILGWTDMP